MRQRTAQEMRERRLRHQLEIQSMEIERVLSQHDVPGRVAGGSVRPQAIRFDLQVGLAQGFERLKVLKDELVQVFGGSKVYLGRENGRLSVEVDRQEDVPVPLLDLMSLLEDLAPLTAVMGLSEDGRPVLLNLAEEDMTHILIAGDSGAGKTALLRTMALSLAMRNRQSQLQLLACQPGVTKGAELLEPLSYLPHMLASVVKTPAETLQVFHFLQEEMTYRQKQHIQSPTIVVLVDHIVKVIEESDGTLQKPITRLLRRGAESGIHLIFTTSRPKAEPLTGWLKADLPVRIVGHFTDVEDAHAASGLPDSDAEYLLGEGDFLAVGNGDKLRFQATYIGNYDLHMTLDDLHRKRPPALLAQKMNMRPKLEESERAAVNHPDQPFVYDGKAVSLDVSSAKVVFPKPQVRLQEPGAEDQQ